MYYNVYFIKYHLKENTSIQLVHKDCWYLKILILHLRIIIKSETVPHNTKEAASATCMPSNVNTSDMNSSLAETKQIN